MHSIFSTKEVLKPDKSRDIKELQPLNILLMVVIEEVSKTDKSIIINELHP